VPVLGWRSPDFPAFYVRSSGLPVPTSSRRAAEVARVLRARSRPQTGVLLTVPIPEADELDRERHDAALATALEQAAQAGITGAAVTPYVLERVGRATEGGSVPANLALAANNAAVARRGRGGAGRRARVTGRAAPAAGPGRAAVPRWHRGGTMGSSPPQRYAP
jgi:pseudouridine-5'-phosphate glycosidase